MSTMSGVGRNFSTVMGTMIVALVVLCGILQSEFLVVFTSGIVTAVILSSVVVWWFEGMAQRLSNWVVNVVPVIVCIVGVVLLALIQQKII